MKLFIRIPTQGSVHGALVPWISWASRTWPTADISITYTHGYGVAWGRNEIVREFLSSPCTHLWMIDSDTIPPENTALVDAIGDDVVVAAPYPSFHATRGLIWNVYRRSSSGYSSLHPNDWPTSESFNVDAAGLGCVIIPRDLLSGIRFKHRFLPDGTIVGEDFDFFENIGGVTIVPAATCRHGRIVDLLDVHNWHELGSLVGV